MGTREIAKIQLGPGEECLELDELAALADGSLGHGSCAEAQRHLDGCTHCKAEMDLLLSFERSTPSAKELATVSEVEKHVRARLGSPSRVQRSKERFRPAFRNWRLYTAIGTFAAAAATVALVYLPEMRAPELAHINDAQQYRSQEIVNLVPSGELQLVPKEMSWQPVSGASSYQVSIRTVDDTNVWSANSSQSKLNIPADATARLHSDRRYVWQVTAVDVSGRMLARSNLQHFDIRTRR